MCADANLKWFACLFGNVRTSSHRQREERRTPNRTVIVLTAKPVALWTLMNAGEENEIADAAEKAKTLLNTCCEKMFNEDKIPKRFEMLCSIGPISDYVLAEKITQEWIKSRGPGPRAAYAETLATRYNFKFIMHFEAFFALSDVTVKVKILSSDESGTVLEIRPRREDEI